MKLKGNSYLLQVALGSRFHDRFTDRGGPSETQLANIGMIRYGLA